MTSPDTSHDAHIEDDADRQERRASLPFDDMAPPRWMLYRTDTEPLLVRFLAPDEELLRSNFGYFASSSRSAIERRAQQGEGRVWLGNWLVAIDTVVSLDEANAPPFELESETLVPAFDIKDEAVLVAAIETLTDVIATAEEQPDHIRTAWSGLIAAVSQFATSFPDQFSPAAIQNVRRAIKTYGNDVEPQYTNELVGVLATLYEQEVEQGAIQDAFIDMLANDRPHPTVAHHALGLFIDRMDDVDQSVLDEIITQHEILLGLSRYRNSLTAEEYELYVHRLDRLEKRSGSEDE